MKINILELTKILFTVSNFITITNQQQTMKKLLAVALLIILSMCTLSSCADHKTINGVKYRPYGIINEGSEHNPDIYYEVSGWAVFSGIMFSECLLIPTIYTFGYNLWEPVSTMADHNNNKDAGKVH